MDTKRISFVATSRNDDHGSGLLARMQAFVSGLVEQCHRHKLDAELILVEWNPPEDRPRLLEALCWPASSRCQIRIVEVPAAIHNRFQHAAALPLFQMIAKNVGIRRAHSPFVVATNVDLLFSDELIRFLASVELRDDAMYRVDRHDVEGVPLDAPIAEQLAACRSNRLRVCAREGTYAMHSPLRAWLNWTKASMGRRIRSLQRFDPHEPPMLHINACGDFTLLSKQSWLALRGYPELEAFSMNIDALLCFMANYSGIREVVLRGRLYHLEHGAGWTPESDNALQEKVAQRGLPWITWEQVLSWAREMSRKQGPLVFNSEEWGLAGEPLREFEPCGVYSA